MDTICGWRRSVDSRVSIKSPWYVESRNAKDHRRPAPPSLTTRSTTLATLEKDMYGREGSRRPETGCGQGRLYTTSTCCCGCACCGMRGWLVALLLCVSPPSCACSCACACACDCVCGPAGPAVTSSWEDGGEGGMDGERDKEAAAEAWAWASDGPALNFDSDASGPAPAPAPALIT